MGSCPRFGAAPDLWFSMGEIAEEFPTGQSDSEGSSSGLDLGESSRNKSINRCKWAGCGRWFGHLDLLASHVTRVHAACGQGGLFYCGWEGCTRGDRGFNARYKMLVHVRTHTNEKPHHCFKCDKSFSRAENLKIHARSHTGERPYVCPIPGCGKAYSNSSDRFKHTRTHSVDKPYMCKVPGCPKRYTDPSSLRKHVKTYRHFQNVSEQEPPVQTTNSHYCEAETERQFTNAINCGSSENEDEHTKYNISDSHSDRTSFSHSQTINNLSNTSMDIETASSETVHTSDESNPHAHQPPPSQWPSSEYGFFCSWLSLWRCPDNQEQESPLDLTVHRSTART